jgi:hypothetical protein
VDVGEPIVLDIKRMASRWWASQPVSLRIGDQLVPLANASSSLSMLARRRGRFPDDRVWVECDAPFGLLRARRALAVDGFAVVLPVGPAVALPVGRSEVFDHAIVRTTAPSGGETMGLREYRRGDPPRQIHWAATVRYDKLIARERLDTSRPVVALWFDACSFAGAPLDEQSGYEWSIRLTAGMLRSWAGGGARIELVLPGQVVRVNWLADLPVSLEALALLPIDASRVERLALRGSQPDVVITADDSGSYRSSARVIRVNRDGIDDERQAEVIRTLGGGRLARVG